MSDLSDLRDRYRQSLEAFIRGDRLWRLTSGDRILAPLAGWRPAVRGEATEGHASGGLASSRHTGG